MSYPAATLNFLSVKKKWYVYVTVPPELREAFGKQTQVKRSTGTADRRAAERKLHSIASEIYAEFDKRKPNPVLAKMAELEALIVPPEAQDWQLYQLMKRNASQDAEASRDAVAMLREFSQHLKTGDLVPQREGSGVVYYDKNAGRKREILAELSEELTATVNSDNLFWAVVKEYLQETSFTRHQVKTDTIRALKEFSDFLGEKSVSDISPTLIYDYASALSKEKNFAKDTITGRISKLQGLLNHSVRKGYILNNPAHGLRLSGYGAERESYVPFSKDELFQIFKQEMKPRERLLFSIAVTTGMRLDEIALLTWDNIKTEDGINYFDLTREGYLVKNKGSARKVPVHPALLLPQRGEGRLFDYKTNPDGKTTTASEIANKQIRKVTRDKRKVFHSFRHTIKDLFRDTGVSKEIQDFITGHAAGDVAGRYGSGPSLKARQAAIAAVEHPWLTDAP